MFNGFIELYTEVSPHSLRSSRILSAIVVAKYVPL
jgi:hypothetical protein